MTAYVPGIEEKDLKKVILAIQQLAAGRSNATGQVTLTANAAATAVGDINVSSSSAIILVPVTSNAAAAQATNYIVSANKSFVINHAMNAQTDRSYVYAIQG